MQTPMEALEENPFFENRKTEIELNDDGTITRILVVYANSPLNEKHCFDSLMEAAQTVRKGSSTFDRTILRGK
jgi:hypothetical protein